MAAVGRVGGAWVQALVTVILACLSALRRETMFYLLFPLLMPTEGCSPEFPLSLGVWPPTSRAGKMLQWRLLSLRPGETEGMPLVGWPLHGHHQEHTLSGGLRFASPTGATPRMLS